MSMAGPSALRITAILVFAFAAGHTLGYPWVGHMSAANHVRLLEALDSTRTVTQGFARTYGDTHVGFGWYISLFLVVQGLVTWRLARVAATAGALVRYVTALFAAQYAVTVVLDLFYFFWGPIVFSALVAVGYAISFVSAGRGNAGAMA